MKPELVPLLLCPKTGKPLAIQEPVFEGGEIRSGWLVADDAVRHEVRDFIPRFVPEDNYATSFGLQWNKFRTTQLDSHSGKPISASRFWAATEWNPDELAGSWVLDAGCGAGRFAEIALKAGANVVALDYSAAVDACFANLRHYPNLHVVQGDIYALPFSPRKFKFVYSLGVLQHTPDVRKAFFCLPPMVAPGGRLCVDFYRKTWKSAFLPKYWLRPLARRVSAKRLSTIVETLVPKLMPISRAVSRVPFIGTTLRRIVPIANYHGLLPLSDEQHIEWSILDTFDWLAPAYDYPQTRGTVQQWLAEAGLKDPQVAMAGHMVGRGTVP